jgi:hypothetical protein
MNRWAGEIAAMKAENAMRRAELEEKSGTKSAGADELGLDGTRRRHPGTKKRRDPEVTPLGRSGVQWDALRLTGL